MKNILFTGIFILLVNSLSAQRVNVYPKNSYVQENLDLNAVSSIFQESTDLADFERKLNYPDYRISNLDLNDDNKVDYLRVTSNIVNNVQIILIQAEISPNIYEDIATINIVLNSYLNEANKNSGHKLINILSPIIYTALTIILSKATY
ncbi:hypothetical protein ABXT06_03135 [Flavobacterium sp. UW10123]|uniref:hypothetical protein n=1 Tax=Flavobacterium sp. UW10123 TaxID=3230800 RepID=UPI0033983578